MSFNIEKETIKNTDYRKIVSTTDTMQLVFMSIKKGSGIDKEIHTKTTQFIRVESGEGLVLMKYKSGVVKRFILKKDFAIIIPPGIAHEVINTGNKALQLYTIYSPPEHKKGKKTK